MSPIDLLSEVATIGLARQECLFTADALKTMFGKSWKALVLLTDEVYWKFMQNFFMKWGMRKSIIWIHQEPNI